MSMEITNNYGNYATGYADSARKTSNSNSVEEYYEKLCKKFPQISFNTNVGVVPCNSNDPEFAKEIEWNLSGEVAANSQVYSFAKRDGVELGGRTVTYDANGNRQSSCGGMRTANSSNKSSDVLSTQNQQKAAKSRRDKKREQEEYLEKMREKRKRDEEYLEELREKRKDRDEYISEMSENSSSVVRAYTQAEYDNVDLLSTLDTKI